MNTSRLMCTSWEDEDLCAENFDPIKMLLYKTVRQGVATSRIHFVCSFNLESFETKLGREKGWSTN